MPSFEEIKTRFANDRFATELAQAEIITAEPNHAICQMKVHPELLNANNIPMGGALFTLADFAFAVASNAFSEKGCVSQNVSMTFLAPAKGQLITAEAVCLKSGRRTCLYAVDIRDDAGTYVAHLTVNGFVV